MTRTMVVVAIAFALGSSLLPVTTHWDRYTPVWKYAIFLAYTAAIYGLGQWTRHGLALPRTVFAHGYLTVGGKKMSKTSLTGISR